MRVETNPLEAAVLHDHGLDGAGEALRILVNEAAKIERARFLGAAPYERTATRRDYANGFKPKTMHTRVGELTFAAPQVRSGDFYPSALEKGARDLPGGQPRPGRDVLARGLHGVKLVVADDHARLKAAHRAVLPTVPWQRCQFHLQQNAGQFVTRLEARKTVAAKMRANFNAPDKMEAERLLKTALEAWRKEHPKLAEWAETAIPEGLTVFDFPAAHHQRPGTLQPRAATTHARGQHLPQARFLPASGLERCLPNSTTIETHQVYLDLNP